MSKAVPFPERFETARLQLRKPRPDDAATLFRLYAQDAEVTRFLTWKPYDDVSISERHIALCIEQFEQGASFPYIISRSSDGDVLGMLSARPGAHGVNIGYALGRIHWGQGFMTEAVRALIDLALYRLGFFRVEAACDIENVASARVMEKAGMIREGTLRRFIVHPNLSSEPRDSYLYAATR